MPSRAEAVKSRQPLPLHLPPSALSTGKREQALVQIKGVSINYDGTKGTLLQNIDASICSGNRIALVGQNGTGKSTLLRAIADTLDTNIATVTGNITRSCRVALVDQSQLALLEEYLNSTPLEFLMRRHPGFFQTDGAVRQHLGFFGLGSTERALAPIHHLSGGLRVRLVLADVFASAVPPEVLLLDEPTNHLDAETIVALSTALREFPGAIVTVSHNCAFVLDLCYSLWEITQHKLVVSSGTNSEEFMTHLHRFACKIVPKKDWEALEDMMKVRATRYSVLIQQPAVVTTLLLGE